MLSKREQKAMQAGKYFVMSAQRGDWFAGFGLYGAEGVGELRVPFWTWSREGALGYPGIKSARRAREAILRETEAGRIDPAGKIVIVNRRGEVVS